MPRLLAQRIPLMIVLLVAGCLASCSSRSDVATASATRPSLGELPWPRSTAIAPLGSVTLLPGRETTLSLVGAWEPEPGERVAAEVEDVIGLTIELEGDLLHLTAADESGGETTVRVFVISPSHRINELVIPVRIESWPIVTFRYEAPDGERPNRVFVAGGFNGWNNTADQLEHLGDGVFESRIPLEPGRWPYKFVIDGEWTTDPANPLTDGGEHGNSLLVVEGERAGRFDLRYLPAMAPGAGPQGAFRAELPTGSLVALDHVSVIVNNRQATSEHYTIDPARGLIRLHVPAHEWDAENAVVVLARDTDGRRAQTQIRIDAPDGPRSPRDEVIYFPMTDRFHDGDPTINRTDQDESMPSFVLYNGGDWEGIRQRIADGYLPELGVTTLWLSPVNRNTDRIERDALPPQRSFSSYHGYWPVSLTETNPWFGSIDDLRALVATAHEHGIAVIMDYVANHIHRDHELLKTLNQDDIATPLELPDGRQNIRLFDEHPETTWFDWHLPTIDYNGQPELLELMTDNAMWWLEQTNADGFRHDAVKHIPRIFWRRLTEKLRHEEARTGRWFFQVGETISGRSIINDYIGRDQMDGQFDFPLLWSFQGVLGRGTGAMADLGEEALASQREYPIGSVMSPLLGNHDVPRFMAFVDGDLADGVDSRELAFNNPPEVTHDTSYRRLRMAFAALFALPGPPMIYYGDEIGITGAADPDNRRMMPWQDWSAEQRRSRDTVAQLARIRHVSFALRRGELQVLHGDAERLVLARVAASEVVLVALARNPADSRARVALPVGWGTPARLVPLGAWGAEARLADGAVVLADQPDAWGIWRVEW